MFGFLKNYDIEMSPDVEGRLTNNGEPVVGVAVTRSLDYSDGTSKVDTTRTDSDGKFGFPAVTIQSGRPGSIFGVDTIHQFIETTHQQSTVKLWGSRLSGIKMPTEYAEKLASLNCDLSSEEAWFSFPNRSNPNAGFSASGICRWHTDFEIYRYEDDDDEAYYS